MKTAKQTAVVKKAKINTANEEEVHPLELKYGKEPPIVIKPEDRWRWH